MPWDSLLSALHITVDDGTPAEAPVAAAPTASQPGYTPNYTPTTPAPASYSPTPTPSALPPAAPDSDMYKGLHDKTDFETTPIGTLLAKYLHPLEKMGGDKKTKISTALELGADAGLTAAKVLDTLNGLKATLDAEGTRFDSAAAAKLDKEVTSRKNAVAANDAKIADLQAEILKITGESGTLSTEAAQWEGRIRQGTAQFTTALTARRIELEAQITEYTNLLQ